MPNEPDHPARLAGWKEIGHHLGVDARTAQRWERERGLPVERVDAGARVTADPSALDHWREAATAKPKPKLWANLKALQVYSLSTTILLVISAIAFAIVYVRAFVIGPERPWPP
jgi:hypothetical protein